MSLRDRRRKKYLEQVHNPAWDIYERKKTYHLRKYEIQHGSEKKKKRKKKRL